MTKIVEVCRDFGDLLNPSEFLSTERKSSGWKCHTKLFGAADEAERLRTATAIVTQAHYEINDAVLDKAPNLKMVANYGVGYDHIDVPACTRRGVWVSNTPDVLTESTADTALLLLLASCRKLAYGHKYVATGQWRSIGASDEDKQLLGNSPEGKTLCLIGFGRIGQALARKCQGAFGMRVVFYDTFAFSAAQCKALRAEQLPLDEALRQADFVSVHANLTPQTTGLIGAREFALLKPTAYFVNAARGPIVDEGALTAALRQRRIAGAGLDVFEVEPLPLTSELLALPNVTLLPHLGSATVETRRAMAVLAMENVADFAQGRVPRTVVI